VHKTRYLEDLIFHRQFRFHHLIVKDIDNGAVAKISSPTILREEFCLFANTINKGDDYFRVLHERVSYALQNRQSLPVVRFADGEYAFYRHTLGCNGLYKQAESIAAIKKAIPLHLDAMKYIEAHGFLAPLIFPGNSQSPDNDFFSFKKQKRDSTGAEFLDFLRDHQISLTAENYIPFYLVYAYLSSPDFAAAVNGENICILNSEYREDSCRKWFEKQNSSPALAFVEIPNEYVATQWKETRKAILDKIPTKTDLCIVGAGVGALLVCKDIAQTFSIPAIDAGHVLNMMNDRVDKSNGARLYTLRNDS